MTKRLLFIFLSVAAFFPQCARTQTRTKVIPSEQTTFGADDQTIDRPARVPEEVVRIVRKVSHAKPDELPESWLLASEIHLDEGSETDLIVIGRWGGSHTAPFWAFRKLATGYHLVLAGGGDSLEVLDTRWNGFREIAIDNSTLRTRTRSVYRFNGTRYQLYTHRTTTVH